MITEHQAEELYAAQDEMLSECERINAQFRSKLEEAIIDHSRWGTFGDGFTHVNYTPSLVTHLGESVSTFQMHWQALIAAVRSGIWRYRYELEQLKKPIPF